MPDCPFVMARWRFNGSGEQHGLHGQGGIGDGRGVGIGRATSALFAERGGAVLVADINEAGAKATVEAIIRKGGRAEACRVDVARWEDVKATVDRARRAFGRLDVLVNCAGILRAT